MIADNGAETKKRDATKKWIYTHVISSENGDVERQQLKRDNW